MESLRNIPLVSRMLANSWESVLVIDKKHHLVLCNEEGRKRLEDNGKKVIMDTDVRQYFQTANLPFYSMAFEKAMQGESTVLELSRIVDNAEHWLRHRLSPLRDENNELVGVTLSSTNIDAEKSALREKERAERQLRERVKELRTLYYTSQVLLEEKESVDDAYRKIVNALSDGWQYPDCCNARIIFDGTTYVSRGYQQPLTVQSSEFTTQDGKQGTIEVGYAIDKPAESEGPFLREERELINTVAEMLRIHYDQQSAHRALLERNKTLEQFTFVVSHNIRGPLASILGLTRLFSHPLSVEEKEKALMAIENSAQELDAVVATLNRTIHHKDFLKSPSDSGKSPDKY